MTPFSWRRSHSTLFRLPRRNLLRRHPQSAPPNMTDTSIVISFLQYNFYKCVCTLQIKTLVDSSWPRVNPSNSTLLPLYRRNLLPRHPQSVPPNTTDASSRSAARTRATAATGWLDRCGRSANRQTRPSAPTMQVRTALFIFHALLFVSSKWNEW